MMHHSHMLLLASPWNSHTSVFSPEISRAHHGAENAVLGLEDLIMKARESLCLWFAAICIPAHHQPTDQKQCCCVVGFGDSGTSVDRCFEDCWWVEKTQWCSMDAWHGSARLARCLVWFPGVKHEKKKFFVKTGKKIHCGQLQGKNPFTAYPFFMKLAGELRTKNLIVQILFLGSIVVDWLS